MRSAFSFENSNARSTESYYLNNCRGIAQSDSWSKGWSSRSKLKAIADLKSSEIGSEMVHIRKAELYYDSKEVTTASELFNSYVTMCDSGVYTKTAMYEIALKYLKILEKKRNGINK